MGILIAETEGKKVRWKFPELKGITKPFLQWSTIIVWKMTSAREPAQFSCMHTLGYNLTITFVVSSIIKIPSVNPNGIPHNLARIGVVPKTLCKPGPYKLVTQWAQYLASRLERRGYDMVPKVGWRWECKCVCCGQRGDRCIAWTPLWFDCGNESIRVYFSLLDWYWEELPNGLAHGDDICELGNRGSLEPVLPFIQHKDHVVEPETLFRHATSSSYQAYELFKW